ncbi:MAG: tail fiber protein [Acidobacteriota bacterium]
MADPFVAEIRIFGFNFAPTGWALCNGQILPLSQNTALFSLLGTTYGGDGRSTFALPDMQGNAAMHPGQGQGLSLYDLGQQGGSETVTLLTSEMPIHNHTLLANPNPGDNLIPSPTTSLASSTGGSVYVTAASNPPLKQMAFQALPAAGGNLPHNNMQPYLVLNFCIALQGVFPPRS